jgi:hypothetical protein
VRSLAVDIFCEAGEDELYERDSIDYSHLL